MNAGAALIYEARFSVARWIGASSGPGWHPEDALREPLEPAVALPHTPGYRCVMDPALPDVDHIRQAFRELRLLVLHGSRARGDAGEASDWDFAYLADHGLDELGLRAALSLALGTDAIDVLDLDRAGGLVRFRVARDGKLLLEREPGEFERFTLAAVRFWLDAEPILRGGYAAVLDKLG